MPVTTTMDGLTKTIMLSGELSEDELDRLRTVLVESITRRHAPHLVVSITQDASMDATATGALLAAADIAADRAVDLEIRCPGQSRYNELALGAAERRQQPRSR